MTEWPLVLFTVAIQLSCGLAMAATFADFKARQPAAMRPVGLAIFPLAAVGLLASLFHLGRPLSGFKALRNLGRSPLSLEVLMTLLFAVAALAYSQFWRNDRKPGRSALGLVTSILGLAAVVSSSAIYLVPSRPVWNSGWLPACFLGTTLLLGGFASAMLINLKDEARLLRTLLVAGSAGSLVVLFSAMWMLASLSRWSSNAFVSARLQNALHLLGSSWYPESFGLHLLLTGVVPIAFAYRSWPGTNDAAQFGRTPFAFRLEFIAVITGVLIGRTVMYSLGLSMPPF